MFHPVSVGFIVIRFTLRKIGTYFLITMRNFVIRTPYNYEPCRGGSVVDIVTVDVVDTSVDNVKDNISFSSQTQAKPYYTNSDVPVSLFGPGITATAYDPNRHRGKYDPKATPAPAAAGGANSDPVAAAGRSAAAVSSASASTTQQVTE